MQIETKTRDLELHREALIIIDLNPNNQLISLARLNYLEPHTLESFLCNEQSCVNTQ